MLDLRWPMGLMFALVGAIITIYGLVTASNAELYKCSLGINVNIWWGLVLLAFGLAMLALAWRAGRKPDDPGNSR
jgi:hypothetical protein